MGFNAGSISATLDLDRSPFQRGLDEAKAEARRFADEKFSAKLDVTGDVQTKQKIDSVDQSARKLATSSPTVKLGADDALLAAKIVKAEAKLAELQRQKATPTIDLDIAKAQLDLIALTAKLDEIQRKPYTPKLELDEAKVLLQIATVQNRIDQLTTKRNTINIDADIAAAEAQLAALQATTDGAAASAGAASGSFNLLAAGIGAGFPPAATAVLALSGALELAAIPMVAIKTGMTGIQAAAAPLAGELLNLQSIVSATFEQGLKPAIVSTSALLPTLQAGLVGTAGALSTVAIDVGKVASSQSGLVALQASFSNIQSVITGMAPGIAGFVGNIIDLGELGTGALSGLSTIVNGLSTQWHALIASLTESGVAQTAIQELVAALGAVAAWIPPLVQAGTQLMAVIGPPLVGALQLVGGALNLLSGPLAGVTTTLIASAVAWKLATVAVGLFQAGLVKVGLGAATAAASTAAAASATTVSWLPAATGGAAAASKFGTALSAVGGGLITLAAAAVVGYIAVKSFTTSTDEAVAALARGGAAAEKMTTTVKNQTQVSDANASSLQKWGDSVDNWISSQVFGIATIASVTKAQAEHRDGLTALQRAQEDATKAAGNYQQAVDKYTAQSPQAVDAQNKLAEATLAVTQAQASAVASATSLDASMRAANAHFGEEAQSADSAAQSTISYANAIASLADPLASAGDKTKLFAADMQGASDAPRNLLSAMDAANKSVTSFADSTIRITPAMIDASGAISTTTKAGQELATGILGTAKAFDNLRGATIASAQAAGDDMPTALAKGDVALETTRKQLIEQAVQHGATRDAAQKMVDTYLAIPSTVKTEISQPGMVQAVAGALGLKDAIVGIPDNKSIIVKSLTDDARKQLDDLGLKVTTLPDGKFLITADGSQATAETARVMADAEHRVALIHLNADPTAFAAGSAAAFRAAEAAPVTAKLGVNPEPFSQGAAAAFRAAEDSKPTILLSADPTPFNLAVDGAGAKASLSLATMPLTGDPGQFNGVIVNAAGFAGATLAVVPVDGNPEAFNGKILQAITFANGSTGVIALDGNPTLVNGKTQQAVAFADGSKGTITLDGNPNPATGQTNAVVTYANGQRATITVGANTAPALSAAGSVVSAINGLRAAITVVANLPSVTGAGGAGGGLVGAVHMATGGVMPGYAPGTDNIPAILSPGEAVLVPELVRALGPANILAANLAASGRQPTFWNGARPAGGDGASLGSLNLGSGGGSNAVVSELRQLRSDNTATAAATAAIAQQVAQLAAEIRRSGAGASIVVNDRSGDPVETARETTLRLRLRR